MGAIFLSYAREDRSCAERLARTFERAGHEVWWDRRLDGGEQFSDEIEAALEKAEVVVVAWSKESVKSRWVRDEAAVGGDKGRLVPVSIDGSLPPMGFRQFHTIDLTGWKAAKRDGRTADLIRAIERRLQGKEDAGPPSGLAITKRLGLTRGKPLWAIAAAVILMIGAASYVVILGRDAPSGPLSKPTIALVSFSAASPDAELRDLAGQTRDSLSHSLSQSGVPVRLLGAVPEDRRSAGDFLLSGEFSRNADKVLATVRLDEAAHGVTVFSSRFEATGNDVRNLPERIGARMAGMLSNGATLITLDRRYRPDPSVMAELLAPTDDPLQAYQVVKRVAAKAPRVPAAQIGVAFRTAFVLGALPREERPSAVAAARRAADRALALAPQHGDTYATWCLLHSETLFAACEDQLRIGKRVDPDAAYVNTFLGNLLRNVGRFDDAGKNSRLSYTHDPYNETKIRLMLRTLEFAGDRDEARKLYERSVRWWPEHQRLFVRNRLFGLLARGDFDGIQLLEQEVGTAGLPSDHRDIGRLVGAVKSKSSSGVSRICANADELNTDEFYLMIRCMMAFAAIGDADGAYALADKLSPRRVGRTAAETARIWLDDPEGAAPLEFITSPAAAPLRRDPRYLQLAQRVGLLAYWRSGRLPDFCRKQPEPICAQLRRRA